MKNYLKITTDRYKELNKEDKAPFIFMEIICVVFGIFIGLGVCFLFNFIMN